jgi:hypothetical protein
VVQIHEPSLKWEYKVQVSERAVHRHKPLEIQEFLDQYTPLGYELVMFEWELATDKMLFAILRKPLA